MTVMTRRELFGISSALALATWLGAPAWADAPTKILVHRSPTCGCCGAWAERLKSAGFAVDIVSEPNMQAIKTRLGVPQALSSCHTAEVEGYVIEGHAPVAAIQKLLKEKRQAVGLAVPGMPTGSPGMEMGEEKEIYEVVLFDAAKQSSYGKYQGDRAL